MYVRWMRESGVIKLDQIIGTKRTMTTTTSSNIKKTKKNKRKNDNEEGQPTMQRKGEEK